MPIDSITATGQLILNPFVQLANSFIEILPGLIVAIILIIIGWFVALGIGKLVQYVLERAGLDKMMSGSKFSGSVGHTSLSDVFGEITKWFVFLVFLPQALITLRLGVLSDLIVRFVIWLPNLLVGAIVVIFGVALSHFVGMKIEEHTSMKGVRLLSKIVKASLVIVVTIVALDQIGVDVSLVKNLILIVVATFSVAFAIAFGIGVSKGFQKESNSIVKSIKEALEH
ncbi:hypothetical protein J4413_02700 [Candidatus Woesearchaeota archaeon]|nr:hypothetical protein [Candidatus Woesearchaeota archaeon]